ncbi:hypothetical protein EJ06DRAFT_530157 [Trichodelitschia bisporula]|uniref:Uncharacterized protein n=1 Tax=Trichodelitschia bisporula TaxID=703511 RepID=A0A6G1HVW1_9PEZI|nr:hypothetical protein EJ06DRAFT_530157 [Trichodelitschia bisporula]
MTNGHPGAVASILPYLHTVYGSACKRRQISSVSEHDVVRSLDDDVKVFEALEYSLVARSFPQGHELANEVAAFLHHVLVSKTVAFDKNDPVADLCFRQGWVYTDVPDARTERVMCFLPSRLHEKYVEVHLAHSQPTPFHLHSFPPWRTSALLSYHPSRLGIWDSACPTPKRL